MQTKYITFTLCLYLDHWLLREVTGQLDVPTTLFLRRDHPPATIYSIDERGRGAYKPIWTWLIRKITAHARN
jgi:hypothetical protein